MNDDTALVEMINEVHTSRRHEDHHNVITRIDAVDSGRVDVVESIWS